ncbi:hypothetical protein AVEN_174734-1 [Araneus ventricosus]|uniref:Uncharacterized protein n=1 Tax=Araneus ventricosus TaxID=182803 RepID=A0A4Y2BK83_ARAVE|nr:hypothetical protein AVEN_174734-1 [Araneus ventricosus]
MKHSGSETTFLAYCTSDRVAANPVSGTRNNRQSSLQFLSPLLPPVDTCPGVNQGRRRTLWSEDLGAITCFLCRFSLIAYDSVSFALTMANIGKQII